MARILVTGSTTGIGLETARTLQGLGHDVVWHARSKERAADLGSDAEVVVGDLASLEQTRELASAAGRCDVVIHNAGINWENERRETGDGIERVFQVNVLAPYVLTALMPRPQRLVYLSSSLESGGVADLADLQYRAKPWDGRQAYSDSKLHDVALAWAVARRWPGVYSNAVDRAGSARGSAGRTRSTICRSAPTRRCGWPPAPAGPWSPGGTSSSAGSSAPTRRPVTSDTRTGCCAHAPTSPGSNCRCDRHCDGPRRRRQRAAFPDWPVGDRAGSRPVAW
jgi:NAD(P)-dependent dehydrogenase (short-subunit alcohol dehydrogenase family)